MRSVCAPVIAGLLLGCGPKASTPPKPAAKPAETADPHAGHDMNNM